MVIKMEFELYTLGNREIIRTIKHGSMTHATFFKEEEIENVVKNIKMNGWKITRMEI